MKRPRAARQLLGKVAPYLTASIPRGLPLTPALSQRERELARNHRHQLPTLPLGEGSGVRVFAQLFAQQPECLPDSLGLGRTARVKNRIGAERMKPLATYCLNF
ncbi:hypothetical protein Pan258_60480 [Symmachiella dynata]|nr:hypothetical protein Pan258_60480 [Symmachiella dynata]